MCVCVCDGIPSIFGSVLRSAPPVLPRSHAKNGRQVQAGSSGKSDFVPPPALPHFGWLLAFGFLAFWPPRPTRSVQTELDGNRALMIATASKLALSLADRP